MIESAKLEEEVERACHEATKKEYLKRIDLLLRKYVTKIDHSNYETLSEVEIKQIALDAGLNKARTNGLLKTIYKCRQGNFKYIKFNHLDILIDVEYDSGKYHPQEMQMRMTRYNFSEIWKKVIWFLISTALVNSLVFKKGSLEEFLVSLASQAFLILSSTVTGIFSGNKQLMYRKQIINNRVIFLSANVFKEVQK
jgi:hypothetical protein